MTARLTVRQNVPCGPTSLNRADSNTNPIQNAVPPTSARQEVKNPRSSRYLLKLWNWSGNCHQRMTTSTKPFIAGQPMLLRNFWAYFDVTDSLISPRSALAYPAA